MRSEKKNLPLGEAEHVLFVYKLHCTEQVLFLYEMTYIEKGGTNNIGRVVSPETVPLSPLFLALILQSTLTSAELKTSGRRKFNKDHNS